MITLTAGLATLGVDGVFDDFAGLGVEGDDDDDDGDGDGCDMTVKVMMMMIFLLQAITRSCTTSTLRSSSSTQTLFNEI